MRVNIISSAAAAVALAALALTACSSGPSQPGNTAANSTCMTHVISQHPDYTPAQVSAACASGTAGTNASLANAYLATGLTWVDYLQWNSSGVGSLTDDTLTGSSPDEQVSSAQTPITAYVNGSEVTFTGLQQQNGTLANGQLTLQVLDADGTLTTVVFTPASLGQFNAAVTTLQNTVNNDNGTAVQQQAQASKASSNAAAEQTASSDLATVQGIGFANDLTKLSGDATQAGTDLATTRSDAANGPNGASGDCYNLEGIVNYDVQGKVDYDLQGPTAADSQGLASDLASARSAVGTLQADLSGLSSAGLPAPAGAAAAITTAQNTISTAVTTANGDISAVNSDVVTAYQVANGIATGSCSGPGNPPSPLPALS
jgi:hypothetical protein